jgi:hypothetical protein
MTTAYILVAIQFEERDLVREHGNTYVAYREKVPMLLPFARRSTSATAAAGEQKALATDPAGL